MLRSGYIFLDNNYMYKFLSAVSALVLCLGASTAQATEVSVALGATGQNGFTGRIGLGFDWDKKWLESSTGHLTGYWDFGLTYWEEGKRAGTRTSVSASPVLVYEFNSNSGVTPYIEAGVGVSLFSGARVGDRTLGSSFNFEDRIGAGLRMSDNSRVGVRVIHYSNAGIKQPNNGIESYSLYYSHPF